MSEFQRNSGLKDSRNLLRSRNMKGFGFAETHKVSFE